MYTLTTLIYGLALSVVLLACQGGEFGPNSVSDPTDSTKSLVADSVDESADANPESRDLDLDVIVENGKGDEDEQYLPVEPGQAQRERMQCARQLGLDVERIRIAGSQNQVRMDSSHGLIVRLTGDQNSFSLSLAGEVDGGAVPGVCIFMAGNQAELEISTQVSIGAIHIVSRGNQPKAQISVADTASVGDITWDARGNQASLTVTGDGDFTCPAQGFFGELNCGS